MSLFRNKWITSEAKTIDDFIETYASLAAMMVDWKKQGVYLDAKTGGIEDDHATFRVDDPKVAKELGFEDEKELWGEDE